MQAIADVVALDMARQIDGRTVSAIEGDAKWLQGRDDSVERNADTIGEEPVVTPVLGTLNSVTGVFTEMTGTQIPNAVRVTAVSSVNFVLRDGDRAVSRSAIAQSVKSACFALGSYAARFRSGDSALVQTLLALPELPRPDHAAVTDAAITSRQNAWIQSIVLSPLPGVCRTNG